MQIGKITQVMGPVVDVHFDETPLPYIQTALQVDNHGKKVVMEVMQHIGTDTVRCIMLSPSEGLQKDMPVLSTGMGIEIPVGTQNLGRLFNVLGDTIDGKEAIDTDTYWPIHRKPPKFEDQSPVTKVLETGIKVIDLLAPYAIERLLDAAYKYDVDIVEGSYRRRTIDGKLFSGERCLYNGVSSREKLKGFSCMKVIKAEIFEHIHFPEGYWFEDTLMGMLVIPLAQSFATIKDDVYYYTCNANSISFMSYDSYKSIDGVYITRSLLMDAKKCGALETAPEYQYHHFLQQIRNNWMRTHRLSSDIELAMFVIACDLWEKYFSKGSHCAKKHLMNMESALMTKDFNKFRKTCCVDF